MYFRSAPFLYFRTCTRSATQSMTQRGVKHLEHVCKCLEQQITSSWNDQLCEYWLISQHDQSDSDFKMIMWWILFGVIFRSSNVTGNLHGIGQRISAAPCSTTCNRAKSTLKNPFINASWPLFGFKCTLKWPEEAQFKLVLTRFNKTVLNTNNVWLEQISHRRSKSKKKWEIFGILVWMDYFPGHKNR